LVEMKRRNFVHLEYNLCGAENWTLMELV
jgi:hypothetical protein